MASDEIPEPSRRDILTGKALLRQLEKSGNELADALVEADVPTHATVRLGKRAMACEFDVVLNPGPPARLLAASEALDLIDLLEDQMSIYRAHTELSQLNQTAADGPVTVEPCLFQLLLLSRTLALETDGGFDPTSGPLVALWRRCRDELRLPSGLEIAAALELVGIRHVSFHEAARTVAFDRPGVELNLGAIGKGYALDRAAEVLKLAGIEDWLIHGGQSSILARGSHADTAGWPIGILHPLFPERRLAMIRLRDQGMSTSGTAVQHFRLEGKRYGHILDPRTGWPVEGMLSVIVLAPTAAEADALSTAFFVIGVENARAYCHNRREVSALLIPPPEPGRRLQPINCGIPEDQLVFDSPN